MQPKAIKITDYTYNLPDHKIAFEPLAERDASKLLVYHNEVISETIYKNIADHLPNNSLLVFNNTKVIQARLLFTKATGGTIEIFVLEAYNIPIALAMEQQHSILVKCFVGGANKWKATHLHKKIIVENTEIELTASIENTIENYFIINLTWHTTHSFATILEVAGNMPLPPYIKRNTNPADTTRYQTIYAAHNGSVAAPTAGLHFTPHIFTALQSKNISSQYITLHVGAGTFKPVQSTTMQEHAMHQEYIQVTALLIQNLLTNQPITAVGTTSLRTLESLYWLGVYTIANKNITPDELHIKQWDCYELPQQYTKYEALESLLLWLQHNQLTSLTTTTQLLIVPGYTFKICSAIITNFHQPKSTLLLLIAAATHNNWQHIYDYALQHDYRFLSYGDGCLIYI